MEIQSVALIGLGALGTLFGEKLSEFLPDGKFTVIADEKRIQRYHEDGVFSNGKPCDFHYATPQQGTPADLLLVSVKFGGLTQAIQDAKAYVGSNTILLSLLNGIVSEQMLGDAFGPEKVLYCVAQGMDAVKTGNQLTYENAGILSFGEKTGSPTPRVLAVARLFEKAGIGYELPEDMQHKMWSKFMLNCGVNQAAMVYHTNYGGLQQQGEARQAMLGAMEEVMRVANRCGIALKEADIEYWKKVLDTLSAQGCPSMRQDADAQRPSEVELFAGTACRLGREHAIPTPINDWMYEKIRQMEKEY